MALTIQQVHNTADQLQEQGIKPTLAEVRKALGGGSFTTISDAMQSWKREQKEEQELQQVELPSSVAERLQTLGADMWQTAIDIANDRLVKEREALEIIKTKAQAETAEAKEAVKTLEGEQADLLGQFNEVKATAEAAAITAAQVTAERDKLIQTLSDTQHQLELERAKTDAAQTRLSDMRSSFDQQAKELNANISKVATLEANAASDEAEVARLSAELEAAKTELKAVTIERNEIANATAEVKGELKAVSVERDKLSGLYEQLTQQQAILNTDHQLLLKQYETVSASYSAEQEKTGALTIELEKMQVVLDKNTD